MHFCYFLFVGSSFASFVSFFNRLRPVAIATYTGSRWRGPSYRITDNHNIVFAYNQSGHFTVNKTEQLIYIYIKFLAIADSSCTECVGAFTMLMASGECTTSIFTYIFSLFISISRACESIPHPIRVDGNTHEHVCWTGLCPNYPNTTLEHRAVCSLDRMIWLQRTF